MCRKILFVLFAIGIIGCGQDGSQQLAADSTTKPCPAPVDLSAGTEEMIQLLTAAMGRIADPLQDGYQNSARADHFGQLAAQTKDPGQQVQLRLQQCTELIRAGRTTEALPIADAYVSQLDQGVFTMPPQVRSELLHMLALTYMRIGEQTNCIQNHNNESCLMPLSKKAEHADPSGSRKAIGIYTRILNEAPDDLTARWMINIAYMTLGEHPSHVPAKWVIPAEALGSQTGFPRFPDIAGAVGLDINDVCGGVCLEDFNGDGMIDILASSWALNSQLRYFSGGTDGTFTERTAEAGITGITGALNMIHADYDNDGDADVLMLRGAWRVPGDQPNSLLRNNGKGVFEDVTKAAGLLSFHPTQNAGWSDYDRDGHLDLFIGNESDNGNVHPSELYHNNGNGTFTEVAGIAGVNVTAFIKACAWGDVNNDGYPDLYLSNLVGDNMLFMNQGPGSNGEFRFKDMAKQAGVSNPQNSFPCWMWDYDNDGWLDIFVSAFPRQPDTKPFGHYNGAYYLGMPNSCETPKLYRNKGNGTFEDMSKHAGLDRPVFAMGSNFCDLDNDGFLDMYLGTGEPDFRSLIPNLMFRNTGKGTFTDVTAAAGVGSIQKGHGVAMADVDNDGDQDIYAVMGGAYEGDNAHNLLFENPGFGNHWITLSLQGTNSPTCAIGARIRVTVKTPKGDRDIHVSVGTGGSFGSSSLRQEIGLGDATAITQVEVTWPRSGTKQVFTNMTMDTAMKLMEGQPQATPWALPIVKLKGNGAPHVHDAQAQAH
ncbi:MAG: CRTAC1 family protein [Flavobacteriales bacterium]|nr:CRTAC1 family protein [Flavobacteriales bacterium]MBK9195432.1 CRTAC1 family protein [Flavobacteriales bacterium]